MAMEWMRMVRVQKLSIERFNIHCYILCYCCLQLCQVSILTLMPLVCPDGLLSCCLLSCAASASHHATASCLAAPPPVHFLPRRCLLSCPPSSLVRSPLICPGCLLCHLSSCHHLLSACASSSHCTTPSYCATAPLVRLVVALPLITPTPPIRRRL
jgi:hypothetical protein